VPVVTTDVSDNALFIRDNFNGFILKTHRADAVAKKLKYIIEEKLFLNQELRKNAYQTAKKYFNRMNYKDKLSEFLFSKSKETKVHKS